MPALTTIDPARVESALMGLAAGDRIGGPTAMALALGECLVSIRGFDPDKVLEAYWAWWRRDGRDSGPTAAAVFQAMDGGLGHRESIMQAHLQSGGQSAGCNPLHRCAPLAVAGFITDDDLPGVVRADAALTHHDPIAGDVAAAGALLLRGLVKGLSWVDSLAWATSAGGARLATWLFLADALPKPDGYAPHVLQAAMHFAFGSDSFATALSNTLDYAGPANYSPVVVGALGGARWATSSIPESLRPERWVEDRMKRLAVDLDA